MHWFKLHDEILNDPKLRRYFTKQERWDWVNLICLSNTGRNRGIISLRHDEIAFALDMSDQEWVVFSAKLIKHRMIEHVENGDVRMIPWYGLGGMVFVLPSDDESRMEWNAMRLRVAPRIFERDQHTCVYCGSMLNLSIDHVVPISKGGTHEDSNLVTCCRPCNSSKNAKDLEEWQR